jgi:hypothetical protein
MPHWLTASELSKSYGSLEVFTDVDLAIEAGYPAVRLSFSGPAKTAPPSARRTASLAVAALALAPAGPASAIIGDED